MFHIIREETEWGGKRLILETGKVARQAWGSVWVRYGDTVVLCTVCGSSKRSDGNYFLPLSVHYHEKTFSAGRIPGGFLKREGKMSEHEILSSRLIDRSIRPLFPKYFFHEIQVICTVLSFEEGADPVLAAMMGTSAALSMSGLPFHGPSAGARVGYDGEEFILNPKPDQAKILDLVVGAGKDGVILIECQAQEISEEVILKGITFGQQQLEPVLSLLHRFQEKVPVPSHHFDDHHHQVEQIKTHLLMDCFYQPLSACHGIRETRERNEALKALLKKFQASVESAGVCEDAGLTEMVFFDVWRTCVQDYISGTQERLDGRRVQEIRNISCEVGILPKCHGSALFTRGNTQALVVATLGSKQDDSQLVERLSGISRENFMLNYNFPPYSVGETGKFAGPGRREIGHGRLGWKALQAVLCENEYAVRLVSEITESYGSSSMATVCGASLALMDAGVKMTRPVAGIAMGLIHRKEQFTVLSDISGTEDFLGDMDFKVAGTQEGVTAMQVDLKVEGLTEEVMHCALAQAREGRMHILDKMQEQSLSQSRQSVNDRAPRFHSFKIPTDKIRDLIGPGGKNIREICESTRSKIDIKDDGTLSIFSTTQDDATLAIQRIKGLVQGPEEGEIYAGVVKKLADFGAFVGFGFSQDGLVHISEVSESRINNLSDVLSEGQAVKVRFLGVDQRGRWRLSMRQAVEN